MLTPSFECIISMLTFLSPFVHQLPRPKPPTKWETFALKKGKADFKNSFLKINSLILFRFDGSDDLLVL